MDLTSDFIVKLVLGVVALGLLWGGAAWFVHKLEDAGANEEKAKSLEGLQKLQQKGDAASAKPVTGQKASLLRRMRRNRGVR